MASLFKHLCPLISRSNPSINVVIPQFSRIVVVVILIIAGLSYGCKDESQRMYRVSDDESEEILYLFNNIALHRLHIDYPSPHGLKNYFSIVRAHWECEPTLITFTGDEIDETIIGPVISLNIIGDEIIYGIAETSESESNYIVYFVFTKLGNKLTTYKSEILFIDYLKSLNVLSVKYYRPEDIMSRRGQ
jgi:hypothetical protein